MIMDTMTKTKSAFHLWRESLELSHEEAAKVIGTTVQMAKYLDAGIGPDGKPCLPKAWTRMLMTAAFRGHEFKPWPM